MPNFRTSAACLLLLVVSSAALADYKKKIVGDCTMKLFDRYFPCGRTVEIQNTSGKNAFLFRQGKTIFLLVGASDRQPDLENFYAKIGRFAILADGKKPAVDDGMEGECHVNVSADGAKVHRIACDIASPTKGTKYNFRVQNISSVR